MAEGVGPRLVCSRSAAPASPLTEALQPGARRPPRARYLSAAAASPPVRCPRADMRLAAAANEAYTASLAVSELLGCRQCGGGRAPDEVPREGPAGRAGGRPGGRGERVASRCAPAGLRSSGRAQGGRAPSLASLGPGRGRRCCRGPSGGACARPAARPAAPSLRVGPGRSPASCVERQRKASGRWSRRPGAPASTTRGTKRPLAAGTGPRREPPSRNILYFPMRLQWPPFESD